MTIEPLPLDGGVRVVRFSGELDFSTTAELVPELGGITEAAEAVILDLTAVSFFDSSGVRLVDHVARSCAHAGVAFRAVAPAGGVPRRVLEIVGLADSLTSLDLEAALAHVRAR